MRAIAGHAALVRLIAVGAILWSGLSDWGRVAVAQPQVTVPPVVLVAAVGPPVSPNGLLVQWQAPDFVVALDVIRNGRVPNDPLFKAWGPLPGGYRQVLD